MRPTPNLGLKQAVLFCITSLLLCDLSIAANDRGLFWKVESGQATVYLFGSIHLARADIYPLRKEINQAFEQSESLVVEVDIQAADQLALQQWLLQYSLYPGTETIEDHIDADTYRELASYLQQQQIPLQPLAKQKPGFLATALSTIQLIKLGFSPELGLDMHFLQRARGSKTILELETMEQQLSLLANMPNPDLVIRQTLSQLKTLDGMMEQVVKAWKKGDEQALAKLMSEDDLEAHPEFAEVYEELLGKRNVGMTEKISGYLQTDKSYFVVVGAAHLSGDDSIIRLLQTSGYRVSRL